MGGRVYRIGSFNLCNFSLDQLGKRDLDTMAKIIDDNKLDIVAFQEVLGGGKPIGYVKTASQKVREGYYKRSLLGHLSGNWDVASFNTETSAKDYQFLGEDQRDESYGLIWKKALFERATDEDGNIDTHQKIGNYRYNKELGQMRLRRAPNYARLKVIGRPIEIRLIIVHLISGKPKKENVKVDLDGIGATSLRRKEFEVLAGKVYPRVQVLQSPKGVVPYTIILGDYNMNLPESGATTAKMLSEMQFDGNGDPSAEPTAIRSTIHTRQTDLTTLNSTNDGFANNFDHFSFDDRVLLQVDPNGIHSINAVNYYTNESTKFSDYRNKISDHIPIIMELRV